MAHEARALVVVGVLLCLFGVQRGDAADFGFGACPVKKVVQDFDVGKYAGLWYELERYFVIFELNGKCVTAQYGFNSSTGQLSVKNTMVDSWTKQEKSIEGYAVFTNATAKPVEAKLTLTFKIPVIGVETKSPYWVLDTDYENYAVVYTCTSRFHLLRAELAWILTRTPVITDAIQQKIEDSIKQAGLNRGSFRKTRHDCQKPNATETASSPSPSLSSSSSSSLSSSTSTSPKADVD